MKPVFHRIVGGSCLRQIAREFDVSHSTIQRRVERLGRHCLLFLEERRPRVPQEPLVLDGFRTFENSQYWPYDLNLVIGESHFIYGFNDAELRRSGTMRPSQRRKRTKLERIYGRPAPQATRDAVRELIERVVPEGGSAVVTTDDHGAYPRGFRRAKNREIEHRHLSSKLSRTPQNPLFPVNLADLLLRHCGANHKRETIAFSKRRQGAMYGAAILAVWRNYVKSSSENKRDDPPGVKLGILENRLSAKELLRSRRFPWRVPLSGWVRRCYFARIPTRRIPRARSHRLTYAI